MRGEGETAIAERKGVQKEGITGQEVKRVEVMAVL